MSKSSDIIESIKECMNEGSLSTVAKLPIGSLVRSNYDYPVIVGYEDTHPDPDWLDQQDDKRVHELPPRTRWYHAYPLTGGSMLIPAPLCKVIASVAPKEDFDIAIKNANPFGKKALEELVKKLGDKIK